MTQLELRNPQTVAGEMLPRNFFVGRESCRKLSAMIHLFSDEGINLHAIPMIDEIENGVKSENLEAGTVVGCKPPMTEKDIASVIVWDGFGLTALSFMTFHRKDSQGWTDQGETVTIFEAPQPKLEKKKKKKTSTKIDKEKRRYKARNGRRV